MNRRNFLKIAGVGAIAGGTGFLASRIHDKALKDAATDVAPVWKSGGSTEQETVSQIEPIPQPTPTGELTEQNKRTLDEFKDILGKDYIDAVIGLGSVQNISEIPEKLNAMRVFKAPGMNLLYVRKQDGQETAPPFFGQMIKSVPRVILGNVETVRYDPEQSIPGMVTINTRTITFGQPLQDSENPRYETLGEFYKQAAYLMGPEVNLFMTPTDRVHLLDLIVKYILSPEATGDEFYPNGETENLGIVVKFWVDIFAAYMSGRFTNSGQRKNEDDYPVLSNRSKAIVEFALKAMGYGEGKTRQSFMNDLWKKQNTFLNQD